MRHQGGHIMNTKIEKMEIKHRVSVREDGRVFKGHTLQMEYFPESAEFVNVVLDKGEGPIYISPCFANGPMTAVAVSADLEQGILSVGQMENKDGIVTVPVKVEGNPYRGEPWVRVILYITDKVCYEPIQKITMDDKVILTYQVLHV